MVILHRRQGKVFTTLINEKQLLFCNGLDEQFIRLHWDEPGNTVNHNVVQNLQLAIQLYTMFKTYNNNTITLTQTKY